MTRRMDIEVTSTRPDGTFTWRQAGAKAPKGSASGDVLPAGAKIGDVLRAEIDIDMDGPVILSLTTAKQRERNVTLLAITGSGAAFKPVTEVSTNRRSKPDRDAKRGDKRGEKRGDKRDDRRSRSGDGADRADKRGPSDNGRSGAPATPRRQFTPPPPELPKRPRAARLHPGNTHRQAVLVSLKPEERVLAEKALAGGISAVRQAVNKQNAQLVKDGKPKVNSDGLVNLVVELLPRLRVAEWHDSVEAVEKIIDTVDLRDLRAIVARSNDPTLMKDASLNAQRERLRLALGRRQAAEMQMWVDDLRAAVDVGRIVAALKTAAQPPKAGSRPPDDLRPRLVALTLEQLSPLTTSDRWVIVLEALAFAPIHNEVVPTGVPAVISPELTVTVTRLAPAIPRIAALFGIEVAAKAQMPRPLRNDWRDRKAKVVKKGSPAKTARPTAAAPVVATAAPVVEIPAPVVEAVATSDN
ncbi:MAG: hypothetical protein HQ454_04145 [Acidimicrobiaceae bacterium]|nr:hypothetical protein [Acidimicrobiaceae bacterium]